MIPYSQSPDPRMYAQGAEKLVLPAEYLYPLRYCALVQWLDAAISKFGAGRREVTVVMTPADDHEIRFQCPNCGHDLKQTIGRLKSNEHMTCPGCSIGINIDTDRLAKATEEIQKAIDKVPPEISIKFFR